MRATRPIQIIRTIFGRIDSTRCIQVKKLVHSAITLLLALGGAAFVAYAMAHIAHHNLGIPGSALREQALISASLIVGLVTIELLASKER
jgi:hypothetical protein